MLSILMYALSYVSNFSSFNFLLMYDNVGILWPSGGHLRSEKSSKMDHFPVFQKCAEMVTFWGPDLEFWGAAVLDPISK